MSKNRYQQVIHSTGRTAGFAATTFMLSMINSNLVNHNSLTGVLGLALAYGGIAQLRVYDAQQKTFVYDKQMTGNRINHDAEIGAAGAVDDAAEGLSREIAANFGKFAK